MYGYKAFFKNKEIEVYASSSYQAQVKAMEQFKTKKGHMISIVLCELKGEQVTHKPLF